jgi:hypothetical protein
MYKGILQIHYASYIFRSLKILDINILIYLSLVVHFLEDDHKSVRDM